MNNIEQVFKKGHKALIGYITVGYPRIDATPEIALALAENGCDIIELGIPFSDPLADGATIQNASFRALQNGMTPSLCLETAAKISAKIKTPLVFMTYYNPVLKYGLEKFCLESVSAGVGGLIIPDLPPEEAKELEALTRKNAIDLVYLLAPTSTDERIAAAAARSRGFLYLVSLAGVTGARRDLPAGLEKFVGRVRKKARLPLCVGFGISTAEQAQNIAAFADGVIVGSKIINLIEEDPSLKSLKTFVAGLRKALDEVKK